jgi:hypothetical protein
MMHQGLPEAWNFPNLVRQPVTRREARLGDELEDPLRGDLITRPVTAVPLCSLGHASELNGYASAAVLSADAVLFS